MAKGQPANSARGFRYLVELDGVPRAAFGYCMGLAQAHHAVEYFIGDDEVDLFDVANVDQPVRLVLAQGIAFDDALYAWQRAAAEGRPEDHDGAIIELDGRGHTRRTYQFSGARPTFYQGVLVAGAGAERHIDTLELVFDNLTLN